MIEELFEKDYIKRTIIVQPFQKQELSSLARKNQHFQMRMFNIGIEYGREEWYDNKKAVGMNLDNAMARQIIKDAGLISLTVNCNELFIDGANSFSANQSQTLKSLREYGSYKNVIDN